MNPPDYEGKTRSVSEINLKDLIDPEAIEAYKEALENEGDLFMHENEEPTKPIIRKGTPDESH